MKLQCLWDVLQQYFFNTTFSLMRQSRRYSWESMWSSLKSLSLFLNPHFMQYSTNYCSISATMHSHLVYPAYRHINHKKCSSPSHADHEFSASELSLNSFFRQKHSTPLLYWFYLNSCIRSFTIQNKKSHQPSSFKSVLQSYGQNKEK